MSLRLIRTLALLACAFAWPAAADVLFPTPLHLTRRVHDSIGGGTTVVEQYCYGNRVITVRGPVTTIVDYDKSEITEVNREDGTYSISRFDQVAKALNPKALQGVAQSGGVKQSWELRKVGRANALSARSTDVFEADRKDEAVTRHVRIGIDSSVALSKDALDVITGSAFPANPKEEDGAIATAAKGHAPAVASQSTGGAKQQQADRYGLPVEQVFRFEADGQQAEYRDVVVRVGDEVPPADLVAIPAGAQLVESRLLKTQRMIDAIDRLPLDGLKKQ